MKKPNDRYLTILRILGTIAVILYIVFLIGEGIDIFKDPNLENITVYLIFLFFLLGYFFLWKNEIISGIILITWHLLQWILVFTVWIDGGMTLFLGLPLGIFGVIVLVYGIRKIKSS